MSEQTAQPQRTPLTRPQALVLCALLGTMTLGMAWCGMSLWRASQPPVKQLVRDGSIIGRSMDSIRYWHGEPDSECRVEGWSVTYSTDDTFDKGVIAALRLDDAGTVVDCTIYKQKTPCDLQFSIGHCAMGHDYTDGYLLPFRR